MKNTPLSERVHIVLYGLRNSGKSSLLNNLFQQSISIVSPVAGTTTDPVTKAIEMEGLGPVALTDTAGFDDYRDALGRMRVEKSASRLETADIVVLVSPGIAPSLPRRELFWSIRKIQHFQDLLFWWKPLETARFTPPAEISPRDSPGYGSTISRDPGWRSCTGSSSP